ncbi:MAG: PH domain-containing protein [Actinomycetota bacterium]
MQEPSNHLSPRVLRLWMFVALLAAIVVLGALAVFTVVFELPLWFPPAAGVAIVAAGIVVPPLRYRHWRYEIRSDDLYFSRGALLLVRTVVPFDRIQYVESRQGPLDRAFGLHQLIVYTGAGRAGTIPGLEETEAQALRDELSKVAGAVSL